MLFIGRMGCSVLRHDPSRRVERSDRPGNRLLAGATVITAVDLDGDGQDELFFYRDTGSYAYYNVQPNGNLGALIRVAPATPWMRLDHRGRPRR